MAGSRDNLEWALIYTGGATPPRKQLQAYTSKMSGPIGPARSQLLNFHLSSSLSSLSSHQLVSSEKGLLLLSTVQKLKLCFHQPKPRIGFQRVFNLREDRRVSSRKITVRCQLWLSLECRLMLLLHLVLN